MPQPVVDHKRRGQGRLARLALAGALTAGALTVVPVAQADSVSSVRGHLRAADAALHQVVAGAAGGSLSGPLAELQAQLRAAGTDSAKLYRHAHHAHKSATSARAAKALTKLAAQENRDTTTLTPLLGQLTGPNQTDIAALIASATQGREQALSLVTQLLNQLPSPTQAKIAGIIAQLSNAATGQAGALASSISPASIACPAINAVSVIIATVLGSVQGDLARVLSLIPILPAGAASQFTGVLNALPNQLNALLAAIKQAFNCASATPLTSTPPTNQNPATPAGSLTTSLTGTVGTLVSSITDLVQKLLTSFLPNITSGQPPTTPITGTGSISSLPNLAMSFIPNFASFFTTNTSGGFFSGFGH